MDLDNPPAPWQVPPAGGQLGLLPLKPTAVFPPINGKDQCFYVFDENRSPVWCKTDSHDRQIRATEWIATQLAESLGVRTAGWREVEYGGESYFGSPDVSSTASSIILPIFLRSPDRERYGGTSLNRGLYLSGVLALDMFLYNSDRHLGNFRLSDDQNYRRLCAIDFADADLSAITTQWFPIAGSKTVELIRAVKAIHGGFAEGALDMLGRIEGFAPDAFRRIVASVPGGWLRSDLRDHLDEAWGSSGFLHRLSSLRSGLTNGALA
ncbi:MULTISPECIES: hypothetical protein [Sphingomonas]|uniref:hypothetical protein n=1 Tax=Sphingomonas TaxID=13687 RepID=UPI001057270B|nr:MULTISPECIES: hypothetical protein [Sphingomonas]